MWYSWFHGLFILVLGNNNSPSSSWILLPIMVLSGSLKSSLSIRDNWLNLCDISWSGYCNHWRKKTKTNTPFFCLWATVRSPPCMIGAALLAPPDCLWPLPGLEPGCPDEPDATGAANKISPSKEYEWKKWSILKNKKEQLRSRGLVFLPSPAGSAGSWLHLAAVVTQDKQTWVTAASGIHSLLGHFVAQSAADTPATTHDKQDLRHCTSN